MPARVPGLERFTDPHHRVAIALALSAFAMAAYLTAHQRDHHHLRTASEHAAAGRYEASLVQARRVARRPAETQALLVRARVAQELGRHRQAVGLFRRVAEREPRAWHVRRDWAISLRAAGRADSARRQLAAAASLNPRLPPPRGF